MDPVSHEVIQNELEHLQKDVDELKSTQKEMLSELQRYKGMVGGIMLAITAVGTLLSFWFNYLRK